MARVLTMETGKTRKRQVRKPDGRGGRRPGAGRPRTKDNPRNTMLTFRVSEATARRIKELREATADDEVGFVDTLERWVREYAEDYGIE